MSYDKNCNEEEKVGICTPLTMLMESHDRRFSDLKEDISNLSATVGKLSQKLDDLNNTKHEMVGSAKTAAWAISLTITLIGFVLTCLVNLKRL